MSECLTCGSQFKTRVRKDRKNTLQKYCSKKCIKQGIHGFFGTKFYTKWAGLKSRCLNPTNPKYKNYGGRGIKVCDEWLDFVGFKSDIYDLYLNATKNNNDIEIDRINVDGNYEKNNCRWVSRLVNANNKRNSRLLNLNGAVHTLPEWGRITGIGKYNLENRIYKYGWTVERALQTPIRRVKNGFTTLL